MCVTARARIKKCGEVSLRKRKVSDQKSREQILKRMLMAWPRLDGRSEHTTAGDARCRVEPQPRHHDWIANRTDESERSLRRKCQVDGRIRLIESGLGQVFL